MAESYDPAYTDPKNIAKRVDPDLQMDEDMRHICSVLKEAEVEETVENIFRYQTSRQYFQYTAREIRRWMNGVK